MAILVQVGGKTLAISVLVGEMVFYLIFKVVRRDFRYWVPLPQGTSLASSLVMRVTVKVVCDFTGFFACSASERDGRVLLADEHGGYTSERIWGDKNERGVWAADRGRCGREICEGGGPHDDCNDVVFVVVCCAFGLDLW